jgi:hypothetical protein
MGKTRNTGKLATQIQFDNSNNLVIGNSASSSFNTSGSVNAIGGITGSIYGIGNPTSFSSSISSNLVSIQSVTASNIARLSNLETKSSSVDISVSSINLVTASLNSKTGSYATTGSNTFIGTQIVSASMYVQGDFVVYGSSSIQYISASSVSIGTNIVQLNTANPAVRFAGISVQDSGSAQGITGSIFWDGLCNKWIYSNPSGVGYSGGMLMSGPRNTSSIGNEVGLTCNYIAKSGGGDHLYDSCIIDDGTTTCIKNNLIGTGTGIFSSDFTSYGTFGSFGQLSITGITDTNKRVSMGYNTSTNVAFIQSMQNGTAYTPLLLNSSGGNVAIGTSCSPVSKLTIYDSTDVEIRLQTINTGTTSADGFNIGLQNSSCDVYLNQRENANLFLNTSGSVRLVINGGGSVGIGTVSPCTNFDLRVALTTATCGSVANSFPIATFAINSSDTACRGLQIGSTAGGVGGAPIFLKVINTSSPFAIINQSNCQNFIMSDDGSVTMCATTSLRIPTGTTAQRPTGASGMVRMNTTTGQPEWYNTATSTWASFNQDVNSYLVEYLLVGGGGGGGYDNGAGGGAGGFVLDCGLSVSSCMSYSVIVGSGGSAISGVSGHGGASCFNGVVALGGGGGGGQSNIGDDGGSGGGSMYYPIGAIRGGFGTIGQGFEGGCWTALSSPWIGAGGGGASQRGFDGPYNGMGGAGKPSTLLGNTCYYAGGGNGSGDSPGCQTQPLGGGGIAGNPTGGNGNTNSGGGGGGGINGGNYGGNGGSGVVIIRYPGCQRGSGGTICSYCGTTIHVFTSSGTFVA